MTAPAMVSVSGLTRTYGVGAQEVHALRGVTLEVAAGQLVAVTGKSGSGKTTLLNLIGGLDRPDAGTVQVSGVAVHELSDAALDTLRLETVSYVFQSFGLVPMLSAAENVGLPLRLKKTDPAVRDERVQELLDLVGLAEHAHQRPGELSGGQQQRVAVARALANSPRLLIADEPTGQLDSASGRAVMALLRTVVEVEGMTAIVATHDPALMDIADHVLHLADGHLSASVRT